MLTWATLANACPVPRKLHTTTRQLTSARNVHGMLASTRRLSNVRAFVCRPRFMSPLRTPVWTLRTHVHTMNCTHKDRTSVCPYGSHAPATSSTTKRRASAFPTPHCANSTNTMIRQPNSARTIAYCARLIKPTPWSCTNAFSRPNAPMTSSMMTRSNNAWRSHHCAVSSKSMTKLPSNVSSSTTLHHPISKT